jgi:hypothetical protein
VTTYNPFFFSHSSPDFIPANPPAERMVLDPNRRESALQPRETPAEWRAIKPRWSFSHSTGELESPYYMSEVEPREINRILSVAWESHGKDKVKTIVLFLSPECVSDQFPTLRHYCFERAEHRETKIPQLAFVGPPVRWKE